MKMILIGQKYFYPISDSRSQRVIGRDRFVIKIDRIGSDEIRKSSNALRDSISAFWFSSWHTGRSYDAGDQIQLQGRFDSKSWLKMISARSWIDLNDFSRFESWKSLRNHTHTFTPTTRPRNCALKISKFPVQWENGQFWLKISNIWSKIEYFWVFFRVFRIFWGFLKRYI